MDSLRGNCSTSGLGVDLLGRLARACGGIIGVFPLGRVLINADRWSSGLLARGCSRQARPWQKPLKYHT
jgi:hypothetical protein